MRVSGRFDPSIRKIRLSPNPNRKRPSLRRSDGRSATGWYVSKFSRFASSGRRRSSLPRPRRAWRQGCPPASSEATHLARRRGGVSSARCEVKAGSARLSALGDGPWDAKDKCKGRASRWGRSATKWGYLEPCRRRPPVSRDSKCPCSASATRTCASLVTHAVGLRDTITCSPSVSRHHF